MTSKLIKFLLAFLGVLGLVFVVTLLLAYPVKWLWNATMPELFGLKEIGIWMAWKVAMLSGILIRGIQLPLN
jgi:hypothetical protein